MSRSFSMRGVQGAADRAVEHASRFLLQEVPGSRLHDVQADPRFQHRGVDLLWEWPTGELRGIEVKGDRQYQRRNYFFELVSNLEKDTPGCFLYSTADLMLYVFLSQHQLHVLPLKEVREWFLPLAKNYPVKHAFTQTGKVRYTTLGVTVPVKHVLDAVNSARCISLQKPEARPSEPT